MLFGDAEQTVETASGPSDTEYRGIPALAYEETKEEIMRRRRLNPYRTVRQAFCARVPDRSPDAEERLRPQDINIDELSASPWIGLHYRHEFLLHYKHELLELSPKK